MPDTVDKIPQCSGCPVREKFPESRFIAPLIVPGSRLACAEAGGQNEAEQGTPLVGASGNWLRGREIPDEPGKRTGGLYKAAGVDSSTVSLCNVINCSIAADHKNVFPLAAEARFYISKDDAEQAVKHCLKNHVIPVLKSHKPKRIDILGNEALHALCEVQGGINRWMGSPLPVPALGNAPLAVPTLHPAAVARSQELLPAIVAHLKKSLDILPEHYNLTPTLDDVKAFTATVFSFDIETIRNTDEITMVGLCAESTKAIVVPFAGAYRAELKRIFENAEEVIGWNCLQFDLVKLRKQGIEISKGCRVEDAMLEHHLCFPDLPHSLEFAASFFLQKVAWKHLQTDNELLYNARDTDCTWQIHRQLRPMLRLEGLAALYENVQVPLAKICYLLHETGFRINPARLKEVRADLESRSTKLEEELPAELQTRQVPIRKRQLAPPGTLSPKTGKPLKYVMTDSSETVSPWKSNDELKHYLYEVCKLPVQTHAKTNLATTDKTAIPKLIRAASQSAYAKEHGLEGAQAVVRALRALQNLRQIASLLSTFMKEKWEEAGVERIHASFSVHGTSSGRLSSSDPNLQNLPPSVRFMYVPSYQDNVIFDVDWSSIENRLVAWFANDYERLERMNVPGFSEHKWVTSQFFDIPMEEIQKDNSKDAPYGKGKRINHGMGYLMGPRKICALYDLDFKEISALCNKWKQLFPKTVEWQVKTVEQAKRDGFLTTPFGRRRWFYSSDYATQAASFLPQSTAADLMFRAMIGLYYDRIGWPEECVAKIIPFYKALPREAKLLVTVHDSLVGDVAINALEETKNTMLKVMTQPFPELGGFSIPAEWKSGPSWGECK